MKTSQPFLLNSLLTCLLALLATPATAELYQWKDENGRVHFSDTKPGSANATTLQAPAAQRPSGNKSGGDSHAAGNGTMPGNSAQERQQRLLQVMKQEAEQKEQLKRTAEQKRQQQEAECRQLREHQSSSDGRRLFYTDQKDENGNLIYLDDAQRKEYDQQIAAMIAEKCPQ